MGTVETEVVETTTPTEKQSPLPGCFQRGYSEMAVTLDNARMMLHDVPETVLMSQISHQIHQILRHHTAKVSVIRQRAEGLSVNVTIRHDVNGTQARKLVDFVRYKKYQMFANFFPMRVVRVKCTDWLRVPVKTPAPTVVPTDYPSLAPTTKREEYEEEGIVNGYKADRDDNNGPFIHHTCVRLRGGQILDYPESGYGNRVATKFGFTGVPVTKSQCLSACKDIAACNGVEYYPFYRECWLYQGKPQFTFNPVQATSDKCWTGFLKEEWKVPGFAAFTGTHRPERFIPTPNNGPASPVVNADGSAVIPIADAEHALGAIRSLAAGAPTAHNSEGKTFTIKVD